MSPMNLQNRCSIALGGVFPMLLLLLLALLAGRPGAAFAGGGFLPMNPPMLQLPAMAENLSLNALVTTHPQAHHYVTVNADVAKALGELTETIIVHGDIDVTEILAKGYVEEMILANTDRVFRRPVNFVNVKLPELDFEGTAPMQAMVGTYDPIGTVVFAPELLDEAEPTFENPSEIAPANSGNEASASIEEEEVVDGTSSTADDGTVISEGIQRYLEAYPNVEESASLEVWPNPNNGLFVAVLTGAGEGKATFRIVSPNGSVIVSRESAPNGIQFDLSTLSDGVYFLQTTAGGQQLTARIVVQH
jgi:hypothetical protein